ncbi:nucleotidyltransferase domain-containing protein [Actinoplanes sp. NBRC 103695]|uniref:nucleotidyltransferase domain-containing protein n=1 Tax=Actinoplanes sp. NBRC 103695 TaxID=3032202 RepID=UPI0024A05E95|nr:nucleotidyltransferase domain-containing protein [Actinoplanes sp. NBRC 103695]GLY93234.1 hypothetical protein Acsp02_04900 [Actinoplanes sp. NBRC 103695]
MLQDILIARVRELCRADERLVAALTYGSFAGGEADEHSDVEFWLFADDDATIDEHAWIAEVGEIRHVVVNEFGAHVAFFPGLIRGEFHFAYARDIASVATWPARGAPPERMLILDRTGELRRALESLPERPPVGDLDEIAGRFVNWLVLAHHVTQRGEFLRAVDALTHAQRHLLWMARLAENRTQHWLTPSRAAETDLPTAVVQALHRTTATADAASLTAAIAAMWSCARRYWPGAPAALVADLDTLRD